MLGRLGGTEIEQSSSETVSDVNEGLVGVRAIGIEKVESEQ